MHGRLYVVGESTGQELSATLLLKALAMCSNVIMRARCPPELGCTLLERVGVPLTILARLRRHQETLASLLLNRAPVPSHANTQRTSTQLSAPINGQLEDLTRLGLARLGRLLPALLFGLCRALPGSACNGAKAVRPEEEEDLAVSLAVVQLDSTGMEQILALSSNPKITRDWSSGVSATLQPSHCQTSSAAESRIWADRHRPARGAIRRGRAPGLSAPHDASHFTEMSSPGVTQAPQDDDTR